MTAVPFAEVIGDPIEHSLSPEIHGFWIRQLGIEALYRRKRVGRGELAAYLEERREDPAWRGCNVTMPLKLEALSLADQASDRAIGTGAANLLISRAGQVFAGNTDVCGVSASLERLARKGAAMQNVTLLGTGGGARAALMALHLMGIHSVRIQSRDLAEAYKLAVQFRLREEPRPFDTPVEGDGLINATPLGMEGFASLDVSMARMSERGWVFDMVAVPRRTALLQHAVQRGLATVSGIEMLVEQAADSFSALFAVEPAREKDGELFAVLNG